MFDELDPNTPAGHAVLANQNFKPSSYDKVMRKGMKKRLKLKNFTKNVKKSRRRRRSHIKGKKIDGRHEQYALSIGMMLGIRCCVGRVEQISSRSLAAASAAAAAAVFSPGNSALSSLVGLDPAASAAAAAKVPMTNPTKLTFSDFMQVDKYVFPPGGCTKPPFVTPPHQVR